MRVDVTDKTMVKFLYAFFGFGACAYGCIFATYLLWFMGVIE